LVAGGVLVVLVVPVFMPLWPEPLVVPLLEVPEVPVSEVPLVAPLPTLPEALELPWPVVPMLPELIDEPEVEPEAPGSVSAPEPVVLHAARDRAMMLPSRTVLSLFIRILLGLDGSDHHARCTVHVK